MIAVDVIMGGPGGEADVSRNSGRAIVKGLQEAGYDVHAVDIQDRVIIEDLRTDAVIFNIVHGTYGEDGTLQQELEQAGLCYVGSSSQISALCMDKEKTKKQLTAADIAVPWGVQVDLRQAFAPRDLKLPLSSALVMKPAVGGSSIGLHIVANPSFVLPAAEQIIRDLGPITILIEECLRGPEYTVAVIDDQGAPRALPPLCISAEEGCYDYEAKYLRDDTDYQIVSEPQLAAALQDIAVRSYQCIGCQDFARIDVMDDGNGNLRVLEINTLPGFTDHSLVPKAALAEGMSFSQLCDFIIQQALQRCESQLATDLKLK
ncbi:MAG: D-alanine--D-alanine ligase [Planctomycetes bacterium]|nr:D-alanine--D-alanine ligase [Planctomycetota bacterium]